MIRRYAAESLGTFAIVFFGCGAIATFGHGGGVAGHVGVNLVFGIVVAAMVYSLGHLSAAHFNPAVTIGFAIAKRFPWKFVPHYIAAQLTGAGLATALHLLIFPVAARAAKFGATIPMLEAAPTAALEAVLTFFLMLVVMSVATDKRSNGAIAGLAIGGFVSVAGLFGGPLTGSSMNPARSLAPAIFAGEPAMKWLVIYITAPVVGAMLGSAAYEAIRGGEHHAQSAPNDLAGALEKISQEGA